MSKLNKNEIEFITQCLKQGKPLSDSYRYIIPFETRKEYELTYDGKEREEDILADTMAVPLQPVKTFGNPERDQRSYGAGGNDGWTNKLIFGDNLQVLKALMDDPEVYDKDTGRGKVRLIYIYPPFATRQEFRGSQDQKAYQDKIVGAQFLEFLRKRLVFLRELLADDGSIYIHLDWRKAYYFKTLMDEVFGEHNLVNEIIWNYKGTTNSQNMYARKHETIYFYAKNWGKHIYDNHIQNKMTKYRFIKPLTILVTKDISACKRLRGDLIQFVAEKENINKEAAESRVLIVTSANEHKDNIPKLKDVDDKDNPIEWITSVSMLSEGWDVQNVCQIVPHEERAFNSKLLIAQVLGRGLRIPPEYKGNNLL